MDTRDKQLNNVPSQIPCPFFTATLRADRLQQHVVRIHLKNGPALFEEVMATVSKYSGETVPCRLCLQQIKRAKLESHLLRAHPLEFKQHLAHNLTKKNVVPPKVILAVKPKLPDFDPALFSKLLGQRRLIANGVERCECRRVITYVQVKQDTLKAYDVDSESRLTGAHSCDGAKSESIYAFSGGAIDSNRRRH